MLKLISDELLADLMDIDQCPSCASEFTLGSFCRFCSVCGESNPYFSEQHFEQMFEEPLDALVRNSCADNHQSGENFAMFMGEVLADFPLDGGEILYANPEDRELAILTSAEDFMPNRTSADPTVTDKFCVFCGKPFKKQPQE